LKNKVGEAEKGESKPNALVTRDASKSIAQCQPDWIGQHNQEVASEQTKEWVDARRGDELKEWINGVME
jgi:hypothetical protein